MSNNPTTGTTTGAASGLPLVASSAQLLRDAASLFGSLMIDYDDLPGRAARDEWLAEYERWRVSDSAHAGITNAQEEALRRLCERYGVEYDPRHYELRPFDLPEGYVCGWVGGPDHSGWPARKRTIYVGVSPQGEASS